MKKIEIDDTTILKIKEKYKGPLVAVIGATSPTGKYSPVLGIMVGFALQSKTNSVIFTGGVEGVGVDVWNGVAACSFKNKVKERFFTLIPSCIFLNPEQTDFYYTGYEVEELNSIPYHLPDDYNQIGFIFDKKVQTEYAGKGMGERRVYLSNLADVAIVINGGNGTLDEALQINEAGKPIIILQNSGGAADWINLLLMGLNPWVKDKRGRFAKADFGCPKISNPNLIYTADSPEHLITILDEIFKK